MSKGFDFAPLDCQYYTAIGVELHPGEIKNKYIMNTKKVIICCTFIFVGIGFDQQHSIQEFARLWPYCKNKNKCWIERCYENDDCVVVEGICGFADSVNREYAESAKEYFEDEKHHGACLTGSAADDAYSTCSNNLCFSHYFLTKRGNFF